MRCPKTLLYASCVLTASLCLHTRAVEPDLWLDFKEAGTSGKEPVLPDFSWAGYHYSETAIPRIEGPVIDVTQYGAIPNDGNYDDEAVQRTIDAAHAKGGGVVLFPPGRFDFCPKEGVANGVQITAGNTVLRGAGSGEGGTELFIDKMNTQNGSVRPATLFKPVPFGSNSNSAKGTIGDRSRRCAHSRPRRPVGLDPTDAKLNSQTGAPETTRSPAGAKEREALALLRTGS